jgi:hypothetical protein
VIPRRATGHVPDRPDDPFVPASELLGAVSQRASPAPSSSGVVAYAAAVEDQEQDESCVGEGLSGAVATCIRLAGGAAVSISAKFIWALARAADGNGRRNVGSRPFAALTALAQFGYCTTEEWPRTMPFDRMPDGHAFESAVDQLDLQAYRITDVGGARSESIRFALDVRRRPVGLPFEIDDGYFLSKGIWVPSPAMAPAGGHFLLATHYDEIGLFTRGSYGTGFGLDGYVRIPWSAVDDDAVTGIPHVLTYARAPARPGPGLARAFLRGAVRSRAA